MKHKYCQKGGGQWFINVLVPINFLLSLMIVFHHSSTININYNGSFHFSSYGFTIAVQRFVYNISECAVPFFYFLSAFLFFRTFNGTWDCYKNKIVRRFYSLFIPYIIFCTFGYVKHLFVVGLGGGISGFLHSLWVCDTMPLWFIRELMFFSLLAPIIWRIICKPAIAIIISLIVFLLITAGQIPYRSFCYWLPVYLMGAMLNEKILGWINAFMRRRRNCILLSGAFLFYILWAWFLPNGIDRIEMAWYQNFDFALFRIITPAVFLFLMWLMSCMHISERSFMKYPFFVYCIHFPIITILNIILDKTLGTSWNIELVKYFFIAIFAYIICVFVAEILQKYTPFAWYVLNGCRE